MRNRLAWLSLPSEAFWEMPLSSLGLMNLAKPAESVWLAHRYLRTATKSLTEISLQKLDYLCIITLDKISQPFTYMRVLNNEITT